MDASTTNTNTNTNATSDPNAALSPSAILAAPAFDEPYRFGRVPTTRAPFPFTERQFARLLIVRSRVRESVDVSARLPQAA
jgi:hypothetical protein